MRKFRNKKLATVVVVFLLVFVMAGAFAAFQTILDVRGRVNLFAPTVDAIIANITPLAAPLGTEDAALLNADDPDEIHDTNAAVRGPWLAVIYGNQRFVDRVFLPTVFETAAVTAAQGLANLNDNQTLWGHLGAAGRYGANALEMQRVAWWAWGHQGAGDDTYVDNAPFMRPTMAYVEAGAIANPQSFETLYLDLTFDNFAQFYLFELELANVGVVALEIEEVTIERVDDPETATPIWQIEEAPADSPHTFAERFMLNDGTMHPRWYYLAEEIEDGFAGLVNITVDMDADWVVGPTAFQAAPAIPEAIIWPVNHANGNLVSVGLRFCVTLENWMNFIYEWDAPAWDDSDAWGYDVVGGFNATDADDALVELLEYLVLNALSGTFRIAYTVVPFADDDAVRAPAGVQNFGTVTP